MKSAYILARGETGHQQTWGGAFAEGLKKHGWNTVVSADFPSSTGRVDYDLLVMWGVRRRDVIERQIRDGGSVCILERGYLGDRFKWTSVSFGGNLNGRATFRGVRNEPTRFWTNFGDLRKPWRRSDGYALLIGQVPGDMSLAVAGGDLDRWYRETTEELVRHGYDVRFRAHPMASRRGLSNPGVPGARIIEGSLEAAMADAGLVVTFNSNTGVESVLAGVPTMAADGGSMAWEVTSHFVNQGPVTPDRSDWQNRLAWKQWTLEEMESGKCWEHVWNG